MNAMIVGMTWDAAQRQGTLDQPEAHTGRPVQAERLEPRLNKLEQAKHPST